MTTKMRGHCRNGHAFPIAALTDRCPACGDVAFKVSAMVRLDGVERPCTMTRCDDAASTTFHVETDGDEPA